MGNDLAEVAALNLDLSLKAIVSLCCMLFFASIQFNQYFLSIDVEDRIRKAFT